MHQTIFFNSKALVVSDNEAELRKNATQFADAACIREPGTEELRQIVAQMMQDAQHRVIITKQAHKLIADLKKQLTTIQAAGGLVYNQNKELLLIFRRGKWDLPKGKLDEGETIEACALREVEEETGVGHLKIDKPLLLTYHTYKEQGRLVLKESHWYLMQCSRTSQLVPQTDEDIEKCEWVSPKNLIPYLDNTHPSIVEVIRKGMAELQLNLP